MVTPCARKSCQYCEQRLVMKKPKMDNSVPTQRSDWRWPASNIGPIRNDTTNIKKACTEPIHEMAESEDSRSSSLE
jgi:hypothetical protein